MMPLMCTFPECAEQVCSLNHIFLPGHIHPFGPPPPDDDEGDLLSLFLWGAMKTWRDLRDSYQNGFGLSEDAITEMLLLDMWRLGWRYRTRRLAYKRFTRTDENKTGADWLWWFVSGKRGLPTLVQAKRLYKNGVYEQLKDEKYRPSQIETLIQHAKDRNYEPLFCFYNYRENPPDFLCYRKLWRSGFWGVSVAAANRVKEVISGSGRNRNSFDSIARISASWTCLVCPRRPYPYSHSGTDRQGFLGLVQRKLVYMSGRKTDSKIVDQLPDYVEQLLQPGGERDAREDLDAEMAGPPEGLEFLAGVVVVSDKPTEGGD